jgi:hypothetical protein
MTDPLLLRTIDRLDAASALVRSAIHEPAVPRLHEVARLIDEAIENLHALRRR